MDPGRGGGGTPTPPPPSIQSTSLQSGTTLPDHPFHIMPSFSSYALHIFFAQIAPCKIDLRAHTHKKKKKKKKSWGPHSPRSLVWAQPLSFLIAWEGGVALQPYITASTKSFPTQSVFCTAPSFDPPPPFKL